MESGNDEFTEWRPKRKASFSTAHPILQKKISSDSLLSYGNNSRRRSTLKSISHTLTGLFALRRQTLTKTSKPAVRLENTYKMTPDQGKVFSGSKVRQIAEEVMETEIGDLKYDPSICGDMARDLALKIKTRVKDLNMPRYKIVCQVIIGQVHDQGMEAASRCIWDPSTDNYACISYRNQTILAVALIHAVYFE